MASVAKSSGAQVARQLVVPRRLGYVLELEEALLSLYRQLLPTAMYYLHPAPCTLHAAPCILRPQAS